VSDITPTTQPGGPDLSNPDRSRPTTSTRDRDDLRRRLTAWLASTLGPGSDPEVSELASPGTTGMSSETVLFDASWTEDGERRTGRYVARLHPADDAFPVFPSYDFDRQVRAMRIVGERSDVPVPRVPWDEPDPTALGSPFFVMERVDGIVPPDVPMPYVISSWLLDADPADQDRLQRGAVAALAGIHGVELSDEERASFELDRPGATAMRRHVAEWRAFYDWERGDLSFPLIEEAFAWLDEHWPRVEGPPVLSWGDSRIGNVLWHDFEPVAVLDWEMVAVGPRELDLGWLIFLHRFFQDIAEDYGLPGLPRLMQRDAVAATYAELSGHEPQDLDWYITYAALRHGIVMIRVMGRSMHFGEAEMPDDHQDLITHRKTLRRLLDGTYDVWSSFT
jgi:aminoglycoside phosphotransferase (APT) family kinase protein